MLKKIYKLGELTLMKNYKEQEREKHPKAFAIGNIISQPAYGVVLPKSDNSIKSILTILRILSFLPITLLIGIGVRFKKNRRSTKIIALILLIIPCLLIITCMVIYYFIRNSI